MTRALHLTVSPKLFYELESVLRRPKIASRLTARAADAFIESVADVGQMVADLAVPPHRCRRRAPP